MAQLAEMTFESKTGKIIRYRSMEPEDSAKFAEFRKKIGEESINTYNYPGMPIDLDSQQKLIQARKADPLSLNLAAFHEDQMVAFLNLRPVLPDHPWVLHHAAFAMMVRAPYWQEGIGRKLLELQEDFARSIKITRIEATVRSVNARGINLYKRNGFNIEGVRKNAAFIDGQYVDEMFIAKILDLEDKSKSIPTLETDRLILRPLSTADAESIFQYCKNPNVSRYTLWEPHKSVKDTSDFILDYILPNYKKGMLEPLGITLKSEPSKVIGTVGCFWASEKNRCMELAYALAEEKWGQGLVQEAAAAVMSFCFENFKVHRIQARAKQENKASTRVMQKLGMIFEGTAKASIYSRERYWDMDIYAVDRPSFMKD